MAIWASSPRVAFLVPWRAATCAISWEEPARQRERVHLFGIQHFDGERNFGVGVAHQVLADPVHIFGDDRIIHNLGLAFDFLRQLLAYGDFLFQGVEIDALTHIPIADLVGIFFLVVGKGASWQKSESCQEGHGYR
jgi:hypothetical protein